ncbi:MAG TPA: flavin reductase family protein [Solirubrobacteraceae bacterium]|nr:flavin reductase family protein [Solirubrobacteraceae bacterium]
MSLSAISPEAFRRCVGEFATGVTVVCAEHQAGPAGMTLNAFTSVSLNPLLVLVSLGHGSRTLDAVRGSERFGLSILERGQRDAAIAFATRGAPFAASYVHRESAGFLVVRGAVATLGCEVADVTRAGDHDLVIGRVVAITHLGGDPLVFHRGVFGGLVSDSVVPPGHPIGLDEGAGW